MYEKFKCFNVVESLINESKNYFAPKYKINIEKYKKLQHYCNIIDEIIDYGDAKTLRVDIDKKSMLIAITISLDDILFDVGNKDMEELITNLERMSYWVNEDGTLVSLFMFSSIWDARTDVYK